MQSIRYSSQILIKLVFSLETFEKLKNIKFNENAPSGNTAVPSRSTDVYDETNGEGACPKAAHCIHTVHWAFSKTGNNIQHLLPAQD